MRGFYKNSLLLKTLQVLIVMSLLIIKVGTTKAQVATNYGAIITIKNPSIVNGAISTTPTVIVQGDFVNTSNGVYIGSITNTGEWWITGNYTQNSSATLSDNGDIGFTGGNGTPSTTNRLKQTISGTSTLTGANAFYNFIIKKPAWSVSNDSRVELGINMDVINSLSWSGAGGGIIRTDVSSHAANGSAYANTLYLRNPSASSLSGYNWNTATMYGTATGSQDKYIEGKFKRAVNAATTYEFPIGVEPTSLDGAEPVAITFTSAPASNALTAYVQPAGTLSYLSDLITDGGILFYDIGSLPGSSPANQFPNCVGTPDGHDDVAVIDDADSYEWILTPDISGTFAATVRVHPGSVMDNLTYVAMGSPCNTTYVKAKYFARNGRIGGDGAVGPTVNYWTPGVNGLYQSPTGNQLTGQTSFGRFRLFGATNPANTSLPVELMTFSGYNDKDKNVLNWSTASERNTDKFEVYRSVDGSNSWTYLGSQKATGGNFVQSYTFYDEHPVVGNNYYRLKIIDNDRTFDYSNVIDIPISEAAANGFVKIFPNPTSGTVNLQLQSTKSSITTIEIANVLGQVVSTREATLSIGVIPVTLDISYLPNGTYFVSFMDALGTKHQQKIIKQ